MIDPTPTEIKAMQSVLRPLGEYVAEVGTKKPLGDYSKEEILTLIEVVITAYQDFLTTNKIDEDEKNGFGF